MKHRNFRIAWSVTWGVVAVLLVVLWVRSWSQSSTFQGAIGTQRIQFTSIIGRIETRIFPEIQSSNHPPQKWTDTTITAPDGPRVSWRFDRLRPHGVVIYVPYWFLVTITASLSTAPWLRWRFSLRTLLLATTLVAIGLGMIMWMSRGG